MMSTLRMRAFMVLVLAHWGEHLAQAYQVWVLGIPRHHAGGLLGLLIPWLVHSEWLHYSYAAGMLLGLGILTRDIDDWSRFYYDPPRGARVVSALWALAFWLSVWHLFEHSLLLVQALRGTPDPTSVIQLWFPRIELHLFYNTLVTVPMVAALWLRRTLPLGGLNLHPQVLS